MRWIVCFSTPTGLGLPTWSLRSCDSKPHSAFFDPGSICVRLDLTLLATWHFLNLPHFFCLGSSRVLPVTCMSCLEDCNALEILDYRICRLSLCAHWWLLYLFSCPDYWSSSLIDCDHQLSYESNNVQKHHHKIADCCNMNMTVEDPVSYKQLLSSPIKEAKIRSRNWQIISSSSVPSAALSLKLLTLSLGRTKLKGGFDKSSYFC